MEFSKRSSLHNQAIVHAHLGAHICYSLLTQIPERTKGFTGLGLSNVFFCLHFHPDYQNLFAFGDPSNQTTQLSWTILPQDFQDSLHLFGQTLSQELSELSYLQVNVLQHADNIFHCASWCHLYARNHISTWRIHSILLNYHWFIQEISERTIPRIKWK